MTKRRIKKIIKEHGHWYPVNGDFQKNFSNDVTFFSLGKFNGRIPVRKLRMFYPYSITGFRFNYGVNI